MKSPRYLLAIFFLSGISALLYQVVWLKYLGFVFGNTVYAAATLIAVFLAGLGIGGFLFSRFLVDRPALFVYAIVEAVIGTIGAFSPNGFSLLDTAYVASYQALAGSPLTLAIARALFASIFLLPPTILMGGTLPLLVRWVAGRGSSGGRAVSALYAANTFGATAGVALAGFFFIPSIGLTATILLAVLLNFVLALVAVVLAFWNRRAKQPGVDVGETASRGSPLSSTGRLVLVASLLMGLTSIADEIFWTRILVLHLGSSVYAYSLMLFCFLIGLAVGSAVIYMIIDKVDARRTLAVLEITLAVVLAIQIHYFTGFADILEMTAGLVGLRGYGSTLVVFLLATMSALLLPTALMGATFPLTVRLFSETAAEGESRSVGLVYLANTIGSITGSILAGFFLIRIFGSQNGIFFTAAINLGLGIVLLWPDRSAQSSRRTLALAMAATGLVGLIASYLLARPNQVILSAGLFVDTKAPVLLFREDVSATVTLRQFGPDAYSLELNGVNVAGTSPGLIGTQKLQGHLPLLMHPDPKKVLHIGFGSGGTAYAVSRHPVEEIRIAEISPEVLEVSHQRLKMVNHSVLDDPRVKIEINDGRNFVLATPEKFDVLLSDSIHPRYAGNGSLYTKDYFALCREKMNPNGIVSMWLPMYSLTTRNYLMIIRAFRDVFPNTTIWYVTNFPNSFTIVIGRMEEGPIFLDRVQKRMTPAVAAELAGIGIFDAYDLAGALMIGPEGAEAMTRRIPPHVDDLPAVEYESGRLIAREESWLQNFGLLTKLVTPLTQAFIGDEARLQQLQRERDVRNRDHLEYLIEHAPHRSRAVLND